MSTILLCQANIIYLGFIFCFFVRRIVTSKEADLSCLVLDMDSLGGCLAEAEEMVYKIVAR